MEPSHIQEDVLERYAMGGLSLELLPPVEEHLLICPKCQSRLIGTDEFIGLFRSATNELEVGTTPFWKRILHLHPARWVAAAALLTFSIAFVEVSRRGSHAPEAVVMMQSFRGPAAGAHISAGKRALLIFDLAAPPSTEDCRLQILDPVGTEVLETRTSFRDGRPAASVRSLARGDYWVRLYCGDMHELLAEYSLRAD